MDKNKKELQPWPKLIPEPLVVRILYKIKREKELCILRIIRNFHAPITGL